MVHLVLIPFRDTGHMNPAMVLASKLAMEGVTVTVVALDSQSESLAKERSAGNASVKVRRAMVPEQQGEGDAVLSALGDPEGAKSMALQAFLGELLEEEPRPKGVLVDVILAWSKTAVMSTGLKRYLFYTSGGTSLSFAFHLQGPPPAEVANGHEVGFGHRGRGRGRGRGDHEQGHEHGKGHFRGHDWKQDLLDSAGVLVNSSYELEREAFDLIRRNAMECVLPIGPLLDDSVVKQQQQEQHPALQWLDRQERSRVVYVSFGSRTHLESEEVHELASALEKCSGASFLWVLPPPPGGGLHSFPEGFVDRLAKSGRGLIVPGWAPQAAILSHPALGAFVTHCGWNSVVECLLLAPDRPPVMICWPFGADQPTNCKFVVDDARVGVRIGTGRDEIKVAIDSALESGDEMRRRAAKLQIAMKSSLQPPAGSSILNLSKFVKDL